MIRAHAPPEDSLIVALKFAVSTRQVLETPGLGPVEALGSLHPSTADAEWWAIWEAKRTHDEFGL